MVTLESVVLMQQYNFDALIQEEQIFNRLEREEVIVRYIFASPLYYQEEHENEKFEQRVQNFEPLIHYVVEQKTTIQGIKMSTRVGLVLITRQEIVVLPKIEPTMAVRVKYNEPRLNL